MKNIRLMAFFTFLISALTASKAEVIADSVSGAKIGGALSVPKYLYHWIREDKLVEASLRHTLFGPVPPYRERKKLTFRDFWHRFYHKNNRVIFAWTNPVTGMAAHRSLELYGDTIVRLEINPAVKCLRIQDGPDPNLADLFDVTKYVTPSDYDLLYRESAGLKEWIILKSRAILTITADQQILAPVLEHEMARIQKMGTSYPRSEIHYNGFDPSLNKEDFSYAKITVQQYLSRSIPEYFRGIRSVDSCEDLFANQRRQEALDDFLERTRIYWDGE